MSEPDWENVDAVRAWLEKRYTGSVQKGSPYFQYLKDQLKQGQMIQGQERRLSGGELSRWIEETSERDQEFRYPIRENEPKYYPEYGYPEESDGSQSPTTDEEPPQPEVVEGPVERDQQRANAENSKRQKNKPVPRRRSAKTKTSMRATKQATKDAATKSSNSVGRPADRSKIEQAQRRAPRVGTSSLTLRSARSSKDAPRCELLVNVGKLPI